jgi:hypothetical protein
MARSSRGSTGRARHSGRENLSMAPISRDSHAVWPFAVRHVGSCWLIAFPVRFPKTTRNATCSFPAAVPKRKPPECDLLHKGLRRPALNHQNGSENRSIIADSAFGFPHRLCRDRHGHRRCDPRTGLSHPDLTAFSAGRLLAIIPYRARHRRFIPIPKFLGRRPPLRQHTASSAGATHFVNSPTPIV